MSDTLSFFPDFRFDCDTPAGFSDPHSSRGIIALDCEHIAFGLCNFRRVIHRDATAITGRYNRVEDLAQTLATLLNSRVYFAVRWADGSMISSKLPQKESL